MTHVTCRLAAKNRDQRGNRTLGSRVSATFTFFLYRRSAKNARESFRLMAYVPRSDGCRSNVGGTATLQLMDGRRRVIRRRRTLQRVCLSVAACGYWRRDFRDAPVRHRCTHRAPASPAPVSEHLPPPLRHPPSSSLSSSSSSSSCRHLVVSWDRCVEGEAGVTRSN